MSIYTISTVEELANIAHLDSDGDGGYVYVILSGDLHITESIKIPGLILNSGSLSCDKSLTVQGDMYINNGGVSVTGDLKARWAVVQGSLSVGGSTEITEDLYTAGVVSISADLMCGYVNTNDFALSVGGNALVPDDIYAGSSSIGGYLSTAGIAVFDGPLTVGKSINVGGYLVVNGGGIVAGSNINVTDYITCDGTITSG